MSIWQDHKEKVKGNIKEEENWPLPARLKATARGFIVLFICVCEVYPPYSLTLISFTHFCPPTSAPHTHTVLVLQSCLSLLIPKSVFKGVSQCVPLWDFFTVVSSTPSITLPDLFPPSPHFQQLSTHILISSTCTDVIFTVAKFNFISLTIFW
jgi:hypothetical protein